MLSQVHSGEYQLAAGHKTLAALNAMVDNPAEAGVHSISHLAHNLGVNASTLTRLAKMLGFTGFSAFQALFQAELTNPSGPFSERANDWLNAAPAVDTLQQVAKDEANNLQIMLSHLDPAVFDRFVDALVSTPRVWIYAARLFRSFAQFNAYCLGLIREQVHLVGENQKGLAYDLLQMKEGDLLILIGTAPYTRSTSELAARAAQQGVRILAISDAYSAPLVQHAEHTLIISTSGAFFANNVGSCAILLEALLLETARRLGPRAVERLRLHERLVGDLNIDTIS